MVLLFKEAILTYGGPKTFSLTVIHGPVDFPPPPGEGTVRHTAVDFELLSSFTELGLVCVCVYMCMYIYVYVCMCVCIYTYLGLVLNVSHPGAGRKNPVQSFLFFFFK